MAKTSTVILLSALLTTTALAQVSVLPETVISASQYPMEASRVVFGEKALAQAA